MNYLRLCEGNFQFMMHSIISRRCNRQFMTRKCQFIYGEEERASIDFATLPFFRRLLPSFSFAKTTSFSEGGSATCKARWFVFVGEGTLRFAPYSVCRLVKNAISVCDKKNCNRSLQFFSFILPNYSRGVVSQSSR